MRAGPRLLAALVLAAVATPGRAGEERASLEVSWAARDGAIAASALALWGASEVEKGVLAPPACRWCGTLQLDADVRRALRWSSTRTAAELSDALMFSVPAAVVAYDVMAAHGAGGARQAGADLLLVTEAIAVAGVTTQAAKYAVARTRPYAFGADHARDDHLSFWSGHANVAFAAAAAGGTVAYLRGYPGWPWVYGVGFGAAAATGYFRMAADRHWLTDVVAAAASGSVIGLTVPWLHRRSAARWSVQVSPTPLGLVVTGQTD